MTSKAAQPTERPMRADARRNYERLVETAHEVFLEGGADASLDEIARRAGVGAGTLYRHFPTRADLLDAVCRRWMDSVLADAEPLLEAEDPVAALETWLVRMVDHVGAFRGLAGRLLLARDRKHSTGSVLHETLIRFVERAQECGGIRTDVGPTEVMQLTSGITQACESARAMGKSADPTVLVGIVMDGLRTGAEGGSARA
ncbi:TetR/AcrR family transcriptional regulator [Streptacidiphilus monticola]|uniref:TetR/AcrR family transcriptional regulator n=1 Tax=Streptacidiphilus monticola TaxID=2161674 RepID=A0ABW1FVI6_9ACTN